MPGQRADGVVPAALEKIFPAEVVKAPVVPGALTNREFQQGQVL